MRLLITLVLVLIAQQVQAATYRFSYALDYSHTVTGTFEGQLQADGDLIDISAYTSVWVLLRDGFVPPIYCCEPKYVDEQWASLSGSSVRMGSADFNTQWIWEIRTDFSYSLVHHPLWGVSSLEEYSAENWSVVQEVPLPAAAWPFLAGLGGLGILKRVRK